MVYSVRILQVSFSPIGGAGKVASLTQQMFSEISGVESEAMFLHESNLRESPLQTPAIFGRSMMDEFFLKKKGENSMLSVVRALEQRLVTSLRPDVIHLHWWYDLDLAQLASDFPNAKFVVSLHDDRALTGGCHSSGSCESFDSGCKNCPIVRPVFRHQVARSFSATRDSLQGLGNVHFIAPSEEMLRKAKKAGLSDMGSLSVIPNPIDPGFLETTTNYAPELESRSNDFVLGFIAQNLDDPNKRISKAFDLVRRLHDRQIDVTLEIVGGGGDKLDKTISRNLGPLKTNELIAVARRWDALVSCSMFENAPLSIVEMASLGIPVISDETLASGGLLEKTGQRSLIRSWDLGPTDGELISIIEMLASERSTISSRLIEETQSNFGWYKIKKQLMQVYGLETGS